MKTLWRATIVLLVVGLGAELAHRGHIHMFRKL